MYSLLSILNISVTRKWIFLPYNSILICTKQSIKILISFALRNVILFYYILQESKIVLNQISQNYIDAESYIR